MDFTYKSTTIKNKRLVSEEELGMGSEWDYINEHMGGHDEDGMPNFVSQPGFADDSEYIEEYTVENEQDEIEMNIGKSSSIIENLIVRIEIEKFSLRHITEIELKSLKFALSCLTVKAEFPVFQAPAAPAAPAYQAPKAPSGYKEPSIDFDDDMPF